MSFRFHRGVTLVILMAACALLLGCGGPVSPALSASVVEALRAPADGGWSRATTPIDFVFPRDHGPHPDFRSEWWYFTGNLSGPDGEAYGYQLTFFRTGLTPEALPRASDLASNQVYMAHFAISDGPAREHDSLERYSRGAGGLAGSQGEPAFGVWLEDWSAREVEPGVYRLVAHAQNEAGPLALDLTLRETRTPVLHGEHGLHQKGPEPGNASYYYSMVGLQSEGTLTTPAGSVDVTGKSWMDHEFGTSALAEEVVGWDWFSLQMDDGAALMLYQFRTATGVSQVDVKGTLAWPDGRQEILTKEDFAIDVTGEWTSPRSGTTYPAGWTIALPEHALELTVTPIFPDQEMDVAFLYWEGAVEARGTRAGVPVEGGGYVELTGYGEAAGSYQR